MTNETKIDKTPVFNSCAHLVNAADAEFVDNEYQLVLARNGDPFQAMLDMQERAQESLSDTLSYIPRPRELKTCGQILDWMKQQDDSIQDETRELYTALGGMSNGAKDASSVFKPWKAKNQEYRARLFSDLSPEDQLEARFEMIDQFHFIMCKFLALGMDAESIFKLYALKQAENLRRWANGY